MPLRKEEKGESKDGGQVGGLSMAVLVCGFLFLYQERGGHWGRGCTGGEKGLARGQER